MTKKKEVRKEGKEKSHRKEKLSKKDLEELMNVNAQTYKRVHGRVKRK